MKAIANEFYMNQTESYESVAIVGREACKGGKVSLSDFKGRRSCHGGYLTAVGWNYPVKYISSFYQSRRLNDWEIITDFFSAVCAPSDFNRMGLCHGCANKNDSCFSNGPYSGNSGAFRCLVEHAGDIAFVKDDTPILYAKEGPYNQTWSTKLANEFMYLCPKGGCREINGYPGDCILGTVPANVIMARNSISNKKKSIILNTLLNASWADALYSEKNSQGHLLSSSTQGLAEIKQLTRSYLGLSASISKTIQQWNDDKVKIAASNRKSVPDASYAKLLNLPSRCLLAISWIITIYAAEIYHVMARKF
ncbi:hypothetical protein QJS04_geneDACA002445 [Acorus gramineus]|uniref:Transferrin-like domain-containing protein n=1 Tax=Acorus gramineus TaxID=55184 RepID=A0AAV9A7Y4_ACOGR|nr:hypothetical protein QJS04_geneDACA002445 [Acorus gramineus]